MFKKDSQINVRTASDVIIILYQKYDCNNLLFTPIGEFNEGFQQQGKDREGFQLQGKF